MTNEASTQWAYLAVATMAARTVGSSGTSAGGTGKASSSDGRAHTSRCPSTGAGVPSHLLHSAPRHTGLREQ